MNYCHSTSTLNSSHNFSYCLYYFSCLRIICIFKNLACWCWNFEKCSPDNCALKYLKVFYKINVEISPETPQVFHPPSANTTLPVFLLIFTNPSLSSCLIVLKSTSLHNLISPFSTPRSWCYLSHSSSSFWTSPQTKEFANHGVNNHAH